MPEIPTLGQLCLLFAAIAIYVVGGLASLARLRHSSAPNGHDEPTLRRLARAALYLGTLATIAVLTWHCWGRARQPLEDNFGAFLCLGILLALFVIYTQATHPIRGIDFFMMPVVLLLLALAAVFGKTKPHEYRITTWSIVHIVSAYGGFVAFAVSGALGAMYLFAMHRLRRKKLMPGQGFLSLERLEHLTRVSVTLGFALLTIGLVTGFFRVMHPEHGNGLGPQWYRNPKVVLTCAAWIVYALVLHSPINPSFRGRRTALLSVVGFVLMIGIFVAVQFMPSR